MRYAAPSMVAPSRRVWCVLAAVVLSVSASAVTARADDSSEVRREFRAAQKSEDWKDRRAEYILLLDYDGVKVYEEMLRAVSAQPTVQNRFINVPAMSPIRAVFSVLAEPPPMAMKCGWTTIPTRFRSVIATM